MSDLPSDLGLGRFRSKSRSENTLWITIGLSKGIWITAGFSAVLNVFQLGLPLYSMQIFDRVIPTGSLPTLVTLSFLILGLIFCSVFIDASRARILERLAQRIDLVLHRRATIATINGSGNDLSALRDIDTIRSFVMSPLATAAFDGPWSIAFLIAIFSLHPLLGWLTVVASLMMFSMGVLSCIATQDSRAQLSIISNIGNNVLSDARQTADAVTAMGMQPRIFQHLLHLRKHYIRVGQVGADRQAWIDATSRGLRSIVQVFVLALAAFLVISHGLATGAIVASSMLFARALAPVERLGSGFHVLLNFFSAWKRVAALTALTNSSRVTAKHLELPALQGLILASNISFGIAGCERLILRQVTLLVKPGQLLAVVGREGAGKSTLVRILVGAAAPTSGVVRLDGSNISDYEPEALGRQIGFVSESMVFSNGTVTEVISRGESPDPVKIVQAARLAGMHSIIQNLPSGYQTDIGDGNYLLSAGERQRLALARAFYNTPKIIILDEPTAHLDDSGEMVFLQAIQELKASGSTIIVVSRLPGLLHLADQLIMLEQGEVRLSADQDQMQQFLAPRLATSQDI